MKKLTKAIKRFFCSHKYREGISSRSEKVGRDLYIIDERIFRCKKCDDVYEVESLNHVEKDYFIR